MSAGIQLAKQIMEENKKVFWRLNSLDPVYTNEDVSKECGITVDKVKELRGDFLMCYHLYCANIGTNEFFRFLDEARWEEEGA